MSDTLTQIHALSAYVNLEIDFFLSFKSEDDACVKQNVNIALNKSI